MKLSTTTKFRLLHVATHSLTLIGIFWLLFSQQWFWLLVSLGMFLYAGIMGVNIGLHRYYSHRSFKTGPLRDWFILISTFFPMLGSPAAWGSIHVFHHAHSDGPKDPHSPKNAGIVGSWFTLWPEVKMPLSIFKRFMKEPKMKFLHKHYFDLVIAYVIVLALINPLLIIFLFAIPAVGCFHGASAIAVLPHLNTWGSYRTHTTRDNSRNSFVAWIFSLGEGWHNNHHNNSKSYRQGEQWWELDHSAFIIKYFLATEKIEKAK